MEKIRRTSVLKIRLTPAERAGLGAAAQVCGLGPSSFARMSVVKAACLKPAPPPRRIPDAHAVALAKWTGQLGRVGALLNQLARSHNAGFEVSGIEIAEVRQELIKLREAVLAYNYTDASAE
jgi:hypothetical protein